MTLFVLGLLLSIPLSIAANLLTPRFSQWWATTNEKRRQRQMMKLEKKIAILQDDLKKLRHVEIQSGNKPFVKQPHLHSTLPYPLNILQSGPNEKAFVIDFWNAETRYPTTAH